MKDDEVEYPYTVNIDPTHPDYGVKKPLGVALEDADKGSEVHVVVRSVGVAVENARAGMPDMPDGWVPLRCCMRHGDYWGAESEDGLRVIFYGKDDPNEMHFDVATEGGHQTLWYPVDAIVAVLRANGWEVEREGE